MSTLNKEQVEFIVNHLQQSNWKYRPLQEELLDHLCCAIERKMDLGIPFAKATASVFDIFSEDEIEKIQQQTILSLNQKKMIMKQISLLVLALMMLTFSSLWSFQQVPSPGNPFSKNFKMTSNFGMRLHPILKKKMFHQGIDYGMPVGTEILATEDGIVKETKVQTTGYGNVVRLEHAESYETTYAQLSEIKVKVGEQVKKGQVIALSGNSGSSTAPHLHFEVKKDGKKIDPISYLK